MIDIPVNVWMWVLAALPIAVLLVLMVQFRWGAASAAPIGLVIAVGVAAAFFQASEHVILVEAGKGLWNAFTVLIVIWPAILIYEVIHEADAFGIFRQGLQRISPNELIQVLTFGWVFVSFLQGITGFGVPVAVGAPLLVGIGVRPLWAVTIVLLGHAWANTFGTLAVAWEALVLETGISGALLSSTALWAAVFLWIFNLTTGVVICWWYGRGTAVRKGLPAVLFISLIHGGGQLIISQFNPTLSAFVPASIALGVVFLLGKLKWYREPWKVDASPVMDREFVEEEIASAESRRDLTVHQAFMPYYILIVITLGVLLVQPVRDFFGQVSLGFGFPETSTGYGMTTPAEESYSPIRPFTHPGFFLLVGGILGYYYFRLHNAVKLGSIRDVLRRTAEKSKPATIGIIGLVAMSRIMSGTGQVHVLAEGTAAALGAGYALISPMVGLLGSFITSSNLASNILFGNFQQTTATVLGLSQAAFLGAQTSGAAIGNTISPGNVILGTTTGGVLGQEGDVLRMIIPITLSVAIWSGLILVISSFLY